MAECWHFAYAVLQENASKASSAIGSLAERSREQAAKAIDHAGGIQVATVHSAIPYNMIMPA